MSNWMLTSLADISLKATIEMTFWQGRLGWFYSFVKWRTCGGRRGGAMLLHMTIHYTAGMCMSTCEMGHSYSTGQVIQQSDVWCLHGFVLWLMAGWRFTIRNVVYVYYYMDVLIWVPSSIFFRNLCRYMQDDSRGKDNILENDSICH
jgi:hypothetical protein